MSGTTAPKAAGKVHSDMERGFIRAEVIQWDELLREGSFVAAREHGRVRIEGGRNMPCRTGGMWFSSVSMFDWGGEPGRLAFFTRTAGCA